jgi:hypothetical protein
MPDVLPARSTLSPTALLFLPITVAAERVINVATAREPQIG